MRICYAKKPKAVKKFTVRLTEVEDEALERLSCMEGVSKNRIIERALAVMYAGVDPGAVIDVRKMLHAISEEED